MTETKRKRSRFVVITVWSGKRSKSLIIMSWGIRLPSSFLLEQLYSKGWWFTRIREWGKREENLTGYPKNEGNKKQNTRARMYKGIPPPFFSSFCNFMNKMATLHKNEMMGGRGKRLIVIVRIRRVKGGLKIFWQDRRVTWRGSALGEEHERGNNEKRNAYNEVLFLWL